MQIISLFVINWIYNIVTFKNATIYKNIDNYTNKFLLKLVTLTNKISEGNTISDLNKKEKYKK